MRKLLTISAFLFCCAVAFAQLKIIPQNRVYLGNSICFPNGPDRVGIVPSPVEEGIMNINGTLSVVGDALDYTFCSTWMRYSTSPWTIAPSFYVTGEGETYSKLGLIQSSDSINKEHVSTLSSALPKIQSLRGVVFDYKSGKEEQPSARSRSAMNEPQDSISIQRKKERDRKRIGLIAQEVEKILPEVVRTLPDGSKGIMYGDIVAVLVEGMKELQAELDLVKAQLAGNNPQQAPAAAPAAPTGISTTQTDAALYQNTPNPFNQATEIAYRLPAGISSAAICIYDLNGRQLKKYPLSTDPANGKLTLSASEFMSGMYIYALVIDNQVIDSKRMTLTD